MSLPVFRNIQSKFTFPILSVLLVHGQAQESVDDELQIQDCSHHPEETCDENATCTEDDRGNWDCVCPEGTDGDGRKHGSGCISKCGGNSGDSIIKRPFNPFT